MKVKAKDLKPGMLVDLELCVYAMHEWDEAESVCPYEYEYGVVEQVELETPGCVRLDTENFGSYGMPPEYELVIGDVGYQDEDLRLRFICQRCNASGTIDADGQPDGIFTCDRCAGVGFDYNEKIARKGKR